MRRRLGGVLILALAATTAANAAGRQAQFIVQVTVPARVTLEATGQPTHLLLSATDIERGYKDVSARYVVSQNTGRGWLLSLSPRLGITRQVEVRGLSRPVVLGEHGVEVHQPRSRGAQTLALDYRFVLAPDARPGRYELPVHLSAAPL
jgi:hypothetical protein